MGWVKQWDWCVFGKNKIKGKGRKRSREEEEDKNYVEDEYQRPKEKASRPGESVIDGAFLTHTNWISSYSCQDLQDWEKPPSPMLLRDKRDTR